ncbi:MAG: hypothetical protein WEA34_05545 [Gemmatimonadota bacterium]
MPRSLSSILLLVVLGPTVGCYQYVAVAEPAPPMVEGTPVRVHLGTPRSFDVAGFTAHEIQRVDGSMLRRDHGAWVVAAEALYAAGGNRFDAAAYALTIPESAVARAEVRAVSWWRSAVSAVLVGVGVYLASEALQGTSSSGDGGGGGDPPRSVIPGG